jgi:DNA-binding transcriptional LysR family regulator
MFQIGSQQVPIEVRGTVSSNSSAVLTRVALDGVGIIRVPLYSVKARLANGTLEAIFADAAQSPERLRAYFSKTKHLPAKITDFIHFLQTSIASPEAAGSSRGA